MAIPACDVLRQFYVFNPDFGAKDGEEHKKLLFYYPKSDSLDTQIQNVGFCEAVVKFSDNFTNGEAPFHEINTEKEMHVYARFEETFLIGATFGKATSKDRNYFLYGKALNNLLTRAYETFRLFFGTFHHVLAVGNVENLKERLDYFYTRYLMSLKLSPITLMDELEWISYMKIDPSNYLKAQSLMDRVVERFPWIKYYLFLCNDRLLLHNLSGSNLPCLYRYLVHNLLPLSMRSELQPEMATTNPGGGGGMMVGGSGRTTTENQGRFVTGPSGHAERVDNQVGVKLPSIFLTNTDSLDAPTTSSNASILHEFYLIVYRALSGTIAMLVPVAEAAHLDSKFFHQLDASIGVQLTNLSSNFLDLLLLKEKDQQEFAQYQYIYYNSINRALTWNIPDQFGVMADLSSVLCDFRDRLREQRDESENENNYFGDIVAKGDGDYWIGAKKAGERELYVITYQKNANLTDVHEEMKRFCQAVFENVFLLE